MPRRDSKGRFKPGGGGTKKRRKKATRKRKGAARKRSSGRGAGLESRVSRLERNQHLIQGVVVATVNTLRRESGAATIKKLPGYVSPLGREGIPRAARKALGPGRH